MGKGVMVQGAALIPINNINTRIKKSLLKREGNNQISIKNKDSKGNRIYQKKNQKKGIKFLIKTLILSSKL